MIRFINEQRDRFGVELICQVLRPAVRGFLSSRGYRAAVNIAMPSNGDIPIGVINAYDAATRWTTH